ncbi:hypothetical protein ABZS96_26865 [Streptomyces avermitilis]|uniref:hypothetical protein n=1 Tax=Streptomyces avermitilis TaxID=33903 RepID=UPI0033BA1915
MLRREYMRQVIADATRHTLVRVAPYVLAPPNAERREDLALIEAYAAQMGWRVTSSSFADLGQPPPLGERPGFGAACRYAAQGYTRGILAIARPAITSLREMGTHMTRLSAPARRFRRG